MLDRLVQHNPMPRPPLSSTASPRSKILSVLLKGAKRVLGYEDAALTERGHMVVVKEAWAELRGLLCRTDGIQHGAFTGACSGTPLAFLSDDSRECDIPRSYL